MPNYIDSHCHLDFEAFDQDRDQVVARAVDAGVTHILNPGVDLENSRKVLEISAIYPMVYAAVGVHPNSASSWDAHTYDALLELAKHQKVKAIGEIGLDYYRDRAPHTTQRQVFQHQLDLAVQLELPVIIHIRNASPQDHRAMNDALDILTAWCESLAAKKSNLADRPGVLHSYSDNSYLALQAIEIGFFIGITGPVTFNNAAALQKTVSELPLNCLLIETDAPFLTPHPHRGKRNEPDYVRLVADKIAEIDHVEPGRVAAATTSNAERLFDWRVNL